MVEQPVGHVCSAASVVSTFWRHTEQGGVRMASLSWSLFMIIYTSSLSFTMSVCLMRSSSAFSLCSSLISAILSWSSFSLDSVSWRTAIEHQNGFCLPWEMSLEGRTRGAAISSPSQPWSNCTTLWYIAISSALWRQQEFYSSPQLCMHGPAIKLPREHYKLVLILSKTES